MEAVPSIDESRLRRMKRAEYERMGEQGLFTGERVELVRGFIFNMSPMGTRHAWVIRKLSRLLVEAVGEELEVAVQLPFASSDDSEPEPDLAVIPRVTNVEAILPPR